MKMNIFLVAVVSCVLMSCNGVPNPDKLDCTNVKSMVLMNEGMKNLSFMIQPLTDAEEISTVCNLLKASQPVKVSGSSLNGGLLLIYVYPNSKKAIKYSLVDAGSDGFILRKGKSGSETWRNDALGAYIMDMGAVETDTASVN